jgi:hypothetical protein
LWKHFAITEAVQGAGACYSGSNRLFPRLKSKLASFDTPEEAWRIIAHRCFAATQKQIIKSCLAAFVPDHSSDLVAYQDIVKETDIFETQLFDAKILPSVNGKHHVNCTFLILQYHDRIARLIVMSPLPSEPTS